MQVENDKGFVNVGEIDVSNRISVSKEIAPAVKRSPVTGYTVPLFPTKHGYEYFVFRTRAVK